MSRTVEIVAPGHRLPRARLLALDYVLAHSALRFLATERERVTFFSERLGVSRLDLPTRFGRPDGGTVPRDFTDGHPVCVSADAKSPTTRIRITGLSARLLERLRET